MFVDIPEKLLCGLSVHINKGFYLVRITFWNKFFSDMILEMKPIYAHPRSFAQLLRHPVFCCSFFILSKFSKMAVVIVKDVL